MWLWNLSPATGKLHIKCGHELQFDSGQLSLRTKQLFKTISPDSISSSPQEVKNSTNLIQNVSQNHYLGTCTLGGLQSVSSTYTDSHVNRSRDAKTYFTDVLASPIASSNRERSPASELVNRQLGCPPGSHCGPGPVCAPPLCDLPACVGTELCQNSTQTQKRSTAAPLVDRQFSCPSGLDCGPGPVCTAGTCDLPGCADAEICQDQYQKRSTAGTLEDRQITCPPGLHCGPGPECTPDTCDIEGCADAEVCQGDQYKKRSPDTDITHPVCDICIVGANGVPVCGCATTSGGPKRRDAEKACPLFCIVTDEGETLCGCAAEDYEKANPPKA